MTQENNNPDKKRYVNQYWIIGVLVVIILLVGFSTLGGSNLSREEIRSTAYVLAAIRLTQDAEPQALPTLPTLPTATITLSTSEPESTPEPLDCAADELATWFEVTSADMEKLDEEIAILRSGEYTAEDLLAIQTRALDQEIALSNVYYPECIAGIQENLQILYGQLALVVQAVIEDDLEAVESQRDIFVTYLVEFRSEFENFVESFGNQ